VPVTTQVIKADLAPLLVALENAPKVAVERAAFTAKQVLLTYARNDVGSDLRLSGTPSKSRVNVSYQMAQGGGTTAQVRAVGAWPLFNNDTRQHLIIARGLGTRNTARQVQGRLGAQAAFGGSGRGTFSASRRDQIGSKRAISEGRGRKARQALTIGGSLRPYAFHPGTTGKRTWQRGVQAAQVPIRAELVDVVRSAVLGAL
jgi:hypothetical protein